MKTVLTLIAIPVIFVLWLGSFAGLGTALFGLVTLNLYLAVIGVLLFIVTRLVEGCITAALDIQTA